MIRKNSGSSRIFWRGLLLLVPLGALYLMLSKVKARQIKMNTINKIGKEVYFLLLEAGFSLQQARYITAQAAHETGNFTSNIFIENFNLFGMKFPRIRRTLATGEKRGHATYKSIQDSIKDFQLYYFSFKYLPSYPSIETYIKALKRNKYFEADEQEYINGCIHFYNLYFNG